MTLGCLCVPIKYLPNLEAQFVSKRIEHRLWAEIKWNKITTNYLPKYLDFLSTYLANNKVTYHSWTYLKPTRQVLDGYYGGDKECVLYRQTYLLIRNVIRKYHNSSYNGPFTIIPDETGSRGQREYKSTHDLLNSDGYIKPKPNIEFCAQSDSKVLGALQICDLCTGAVHYLYDHELSQDTESANAVINLLQNINSGIPINYSPISLPKVEEYKLHHCLFKPPQTISCCSAS